MAIDKYLNNGKESEEVVGVKKHPLVEDEEAMLRRRHLMPTLEKEKRIRGLTK